MRLMKQIWMQFSGKLCRKGGRGKAHERLMDWTWRTEEYYSI